MNKRGEVIAIVVAVAMIVITSAGIILTIDNSKSFYVGNSETMIYMDYFKCENLAKQIPEKSFIAFKNKKEAINLGYNATINCV